MCLCVCPRACEPARVSVGSARSGSCGFTCSPRRPGTCSSSELWVPPPRPPGLAWERDRTESPGHWLSLFGSLRGHRGGPAPAGRGRKPPRAGPRPASGRSSPRAPGLQQRPARAPPGVASVLPPAPHRQEQVGSWALRPGRIWPVWGRTWGESRSGVGEGGATASVPTLVLVTARGARLCVSRCPHVCLSSSRVPPCVWLRVRVSGSLRVSAPTSVCPRVRVSPDPLPGSPPPPACPPRPQ